MCRCILDKQTIADFKDSSVSVLKDSALTLGNQETRQTRGTALSRYSTYLKHAIKLAFVLGYILPFASKSASFGPIIRKFIAIHNEFPGSADCKWHDLPLHSTYPDFIFRRRTIDG